MISAPLSFSMCHCLIDHTGPFGVGGEIAQRRMAILPGSRRTAIQAMHEMPLQQRLVLEAARRLLGSIVSSRDLQMLVVRVGEAAG